MDNTLFFETVVSMDKLIKEANAKQLAVPNEMRMMKALAFSGILLNGYPYKLNEHIDTLKKKQNALVAALIETDDETQHLEDPGIEIIIQDEKYECKLDDLRLVLHDKLDDFLKKAKEQISEQAITPDIVTSAIEESTSETVEDTKEASANTIKDSNTDISNDTDNVINAKQETKENIQPAMINESPADEDMSDLFNDTDTKGKEKNVSYETVPHAEVNNTHNEETAETTEEDIPDTVNVNGLYCDESLPSDKAGEKAIDSFLYDMYTVTLDFPAKTEVLHIYVYPLGLYKRDLSTEIFAVIEKDGNLRAGCSKKESGSNAVKLDYGDYNFMIRGFFKEGVFSSQVNLLNEATLNAEINTELTEGKRKVKTSTTYMRIKAGKGGTINIFPGKFDDNDSSTGLALSVMMIVTDDGERTVLTPTADGNFVIGNANGDALKIMTYFEGGSLHYEIA